MLPAWIALLACSVSEPVPDFALPDYRGAERRLSEWQDRPLVVLVFLGTDCPLARLYGPRLAELAREFEPRGVAFVGIDANSQDSLRDVARYARAHQIPFPILKDAGQKVADLLQARRTPEALVLDAQRVVRYRGRIDDQYGVGAKRSRPTRRDLAEALGELLAGRPVSQPFTEPAGCLIGRAPGPQARGAVTYCRDVAPILQRHCQACHRPGQVAPFPLLSYRDAASWADTIREVVDQGRMPPWHADPAHGEFANDPSLSPAEKKRIADWVEGGCAEGDPTDLPPPVTFPEGWEMGEPDRVLEMPTTFTVPAEGVIEYQFFEVDPGFERDTWVRAAEVRPGNRAVVHHCTVFLKPPGAPEVMAQGRLGSYCLAAQAPGTPPLLLPPGMAKLIPARWHLVFVVHYTAIGKVQTDRTCIGLRLADPASVRQEVATHLVFDPDLCIPPHAANHEVVKTWPVEEDLDLVALFPHMHLRGRSFRYELVHPDGAVEVLLSVPRYDFTWQNRYVLSRPKRLPAGSAVRCVAVYDNSAGNPNNPDPSATVRAGTQSWDEMFNGYLEVAPAHQDLTRAADVPPWVAALRWGWTSLLLCGVAWLLRGRAQRGKSR